MVMLRRVDRLGMRKWFHHNYTQGPVGGSQLGVSRAHPRDEDSGLDKRVEDWQRAGQEGHYCEKAHTPRSGHTGRFVPAVRDF